jgi:putative aldouronate transport system substrate-binding protein
MKKAVITVIAVFVLAMACTQEKASTGSGSQTDIRDITLVGTSMGPVPRGLPEVEAAINAITEKEIGVRIKLNIIEIGNYAAQIGLIMASQEKTDLVITGPGGPISFQVMVAQNQLMDIGELVNQYGQGLLRETDGIIKGFTNATRMNGILYGVGGLYNKVMNTYLLARGDILEKHGISIASLRSLEDVETVLAKLKTAEPNMSAIVPASGNGEIITMEGGGFFEDFSKPVYMDILDSVMQPLAVSFANDPYKVVNMYKSAEYKKMLDRIRRWNLAGYVYKDSAINTEMGEELVKSAKGVTWITASELGVETNKTAQTGFPITAIKTIEGVISTSTITKWGWGVPSFSKEGAAAVKFLNMMYTDERIGNLLTWGIKGRDYVTKPNGTVGYPEGVTASTVPYHQVEFLYGNQFLLKVWEGNPPDLRQQALKENQAAPVSALLGFVFNPTSVQNEISTITNLLTQYRPALECGSVDPETELPKFLKALDDAGAEKVIVEAQRQLDEWRAANNK